MTDKQRRLLEAAKSGNPRKLGDAYADAFEGQLDLPTGVSNAREERPTGSPENRDERRRSAGPSGVPSGAAIKACIEASPHSYEEVAEHMERGYSTVVRWGSDSGREHRPRFQDVTKLCQFLGCTPNQLFGWEGEGFVIRVESGGQVFEIKAEDVVRIFLSHS